MLVQNKDEDDLCLFNQLPAGEVQYYFYYCLLGNDITSEPFIPPVFSPERASIRLKSSRDLLSLLFASQPDLEASFLNHNLM